VRYDGAAFVTYRISRRTKEAIGRIESGDLLPRYRMGNVQEPFGPAKFSGTFVAAERPGDVVNVLQMLAASFRQPLN
jgi:hypothetical protein